MGDLQPADGRDEEVALRRMPCTPHGPSATLPTSPADPNAYPVDTRGLGYTYAFVGIRKLGAA
jgi:hypothetical protein